MTARSFRLVFGLVLKLFALVQQSCFTSARAQDAELRPRFGLRKRPSATRSVFHMVAELLKKVREL